MPGWDSDSGSGERQLAAFGNALDHNAIRAGHMTNESWRDLSYPLQP